MAPNIPPSFKSLEPDLLVSEEWARIPMPPKPWIEAQYDRVQALVTERPWERWTTNQWIIALTMASIGFALLQQVLEMVNRIRYTRRVHRVG